MHILCTFTDTNNTVHTLLLLHLLFTGNLPDDNLSFGSIFDFLTVTITINRRDTGAVQQKIIENITLTKLYKRQPRDIKSDLPMVRENSYQPQWELIQLPDIAATVNYVSLQDISNNYNDRDKFVVVANKQYR